MAGSIDLPPMFDREEGEGDLCHCCPRENGRPHRRKARMAGGWQACKVCDAPGLVDRRP